MKFQLVSLFVIKCVVDTMGDNYPELKQRAEVIKRVIDSEERIFTEALNRGLNELENELNRKKDSNERIVRSNYD